MRTLALPIGLLAAACAPPPATPQAEIPPVAVQDDQTAVSPVSPAFSLPKAAPLPAGLYHREGYSPCRHTPGAKDGEGVCLAPTHAVVAGFFEDAAAAEVAARRADEIDLPPGYPFVAHFAELGAKSQERGIAVVVGQFADLDGAKAWQQALAEPLGATVVELHTPEKTRETWPEGEAPIRAMRVAGSEPVVAYDDAAVRAPWQQDGTRPPLVEACKIAAGTVLLSTPEEFNYYSWIPVRCADKRLAWVRWQDTTIATTVRRTDEGFEAIQLRGAECDSPIFVTWSVQKDPGMTKMVHAGGCGD